MYRYWYNIPRINIVVNREIYKKERNKKNKNCVFILLKYKYGNISILWNISIKLNLNKNMFNPIGCIYAGICEWSWWLYCMGGQPSALYLPLDRSYLGACSRISYECLLWTVWGLDTESRIYYRTGTYGGVNRIWKQATISWNIWNWWLLGP